jgi:hypothetical protein
MDQPLFALARCDIVRVALPLPVDELFEYAVPPELDEYAQPGCRVRVRVRDRLLTGVIVERTGHPQFQGRLLPIEKVVDLEPVLSTAMLEMLREAATEVLCPFGIALATALPAGSAPRMAAGYAITGNGRAALAAGVITEPDRPLLEALDRQPRTRNYLGKLGSAQRLDAFERDGLVVRTSLLRPAAARFATIRIANVAPGVDVAAAVATVLARSPQQTALLRRIAAAREIPTRSLVDEFPDTARLLRRLADHGLVELTEKRVARDVLGEPLETDCSVSLTPDQVACLKPIAEAIRQSHSETFLLHGVTGSGKTEIYLRAVGEALSAGRQALVMVPEISLTHQILARLRGRFGDELAVLHSGLRLGERLEQWERLRAGATPIAVGARSALFAPLENLGVIVIDEEHDGVQERRGFPIPREKPRPPARQTGRLPNHPGFGHPFPRHPVRRRWGLNKATRARQAHRRTLPTRGRDRRSRKGTRPRAARPEGHSLDRAAPCDRKGALRWRPCAPGSQPRSRMAASPSSFSTGADSQPRFFASNAELPSAARTATLLWCTTPANSACAVTIATSKLHRPIDARNVAHPMRRSWVWGRSG